MREILFKAKRLDNGEWVEGNIVAVPEDADFMPGTYILPRLVSARADPPTKGRIMLGGFFEVDPATVCQYTNIDIQREAWPSSEVHKIFTGDMLGEWGEDEEGNECVCILGVVTYWEDEGRYVLADEDGLCNDWTLEDEAKPENWPNLIHCGSIHDGEGGQHERVD